MLFILSSNCYAQILDFRIVSLKNIGKIPVPNILDTLGQRAFKTVRLEEVKEHLDSIQFKTSYQIRLAQLIESRYDTAVTIFLPTKVIFDILDSLSTSSFSDENQPETVWAPTILIQKKKFKYHSKEMQKVVADPSNRESITKRIGSAYFDVIKNLLPEMVITDTSTSFFWYMTKYPVVKLKVTYHVKDFPNKSYVQNVFSIYKDYFNYYIRFEFSQEQEKEWKSFESVFFANLKVF